MTTTAASTSTLVTSPTPAVYSRRDDSYSRSVRYIYISLTFLIIGVILIIVVFANGFLVYGTCFASVFIFALVLIAYGMRKRRRQNLAHGQNSARIFGGNHAAVTNQQRAFVVSPANNRVASSTRRQRHSRHRPITTNDNPAQRNYIYEYPENSGHFVIDRGTRNVEDFGPIIRHPNVGANNTAPVHQDSMNNSPSNPNVTNSPITFPAESANSSGIPNAGFSYDENQLGFGSLPAYDNTVDSNLSDLKLYGLDDLPPSYGWVMEEKAQELSTAEADVVARIE